MSFSYTPQIQHGTHISQLYQHALFTALLIFYSIIIYPFIIHILCAGSLGAWSAFLTIHSLLQMNFESVVLIGNQLCKLCIRIPRIHYTCPKDVLDCFWHSSNCFNPHVSITQLMWFLFRYHYWYPYQLILGSTVWFKIRVKLSANSINVKSQSYFLLHWEFPTGTTGIHPHFDRVGVNRFPVVARGFLLKKNFSEIVRQKTHRTCRGALLPSRPIFASGVWREHLTHTIILEIDNEIWNYGYHFHKNWLWAVEFDLLERYWDQRPISAKLATLLIVKIVLPPNEIRISPNFVPMVGPGRSVEMTVCVCVCVCVWHWQLTERITVPTKEINKLQ